MLFLQILCTERRVVGICWAKLKPKGPKGTLSNVLCPSGSTALALCSCVAGHVGEDGTDCTPCAAGTYKAGNGSGPCIPCGAGSYSTTLGAVASEACIVCPANTRSDWGSSGVVNCTCVEGHIGEDGAECAPCEAGGYKEGNGTGVYCTACAPGLYKEGNGTGVCVACGESLYSATPGATSLATCLACPLHTWAHAGSSAILNCTCVAGHTGDAAVCAPCVAGTYKLTNGSAACDLCGADQYATAVGAATLDVCSAYRFSSARGAASAETCVACPAHTRADNGSSHVANCTCAALSHWMKLLLEPLDKTFT
ncbi:hypothetical protein T484DRAFT_1607260 [Baffinella frigidus]|nr:hypothetical protein T484DRAFT_1607260 [Cryptophyta sp. CCMP2293]